MADITPLNSRIAETYVEDDLLTAEEFNKIPAKINEIIFRYNNQIPIINNNIEQLNNIVTGGSEISTKVELSEQGVTDITQNVELRLNYDADDKLYIEKIIPFVPRLTANNTSFIIDSGFQVIQLSITKTGTDNIDTSTINVVATKGEVTGSGVSYTLRTSENSTVYAEVNGVRTNNVNITFNKKHAATFWSLADITGEQLQTSSTSGFNTNPLNTIKGRNVFESNQTHVTANHPDDVTMYHMYFVVSPPTAYTTPNEIRQHIFINNATVGGGIEYMGSMRQYSTHETYHVYRTALKYDIDITIDIK